MSTRRLFTDCKQRSTTLLEFDGERVIPGRVDPDLWHEHVARYRFAERLAVGKRVADLGCGTGYGTRELAQVAALAVGIDLSPEAIAYARSVGPHPRLHYLVADARSLPFPDATFDLVVAFELIEHLADWSELLREARRVLTPHGQVIVSTPNRPVYAEFRAAAGPNPFHHREFDLEEFRSALNEYFPHVLIYAQDHSEGLLIYPTGHPTSVELHVEDLQGQPEQALFLIAICALQPQLGSPAFFHLASSANLLRERSRHIRLLEREVSQKTEWLDDLARRHETLARHCQQLEAELAERAEWARQLDAELTKARAEIERLNRELADQAQAYEMKIHELETDLMEKVRWAQALQGELDQKVKELAHCVEVLHQTEAELVQRTQWALELDARLQEVSSRLQSLRHQVQLAEASRWLRLGRLLGVGPRFQVD